MPTKDIHRAFREHRARMREDSETYEQLKEKECLCLTSSQLQKKIFQKQLNKLKERNWKRDSNNLRFTSCQTVTNASVCMAAEEAWR